MKTRLFGLLIALIASHVIKAQEGVLDAYIGLALEENLSLEQRKIMLEQAHRSLDEAKGDFSPPWILVLAIRRQRAVGTSFFLSGI